MTAPPDFLDELNRRATEAQAEEIRFRNSFAEEVKKRERARAFAFRRAGFLGRMAAAARKADEPGAAREAQLAAFRSELGWYGETEARTRILEAFVPVADAIRDAVTAEDAAIATDPLIEMEVFEAWHLVETGGEFLAHFDQDVLEAPLVEF